MKKMYLLAVVVVALAACNNQGESGVVNDGKQVWDTDGALVDSTPNQPWNPSIDSTKGEDRVDIQQRDSPEIQVQKK